MVDAAGKVVVGFDASDESEVAVRWAAAVAHRRQAALLVVHANRVEGPHKASGSKQMAALAEQRAALLLSRGAEIARDVAADLTVETATVARGAAAALVELSEQAQLVVIGNRGRGRLRGALLGSVAFEVATHAVCPVCVVRGALRPLPSMERPIVVGVDGSPSSHHALVEAARLTSETGSFLRIVVAWTPTHENPWHLSSEEETRLQRKGQEESRTKDGMNPWAVSNDHLAHFEERLDADAAAAAEEIMAEAVQRVESHYPEVTVEAVLRPGRAEEVIARAASDASLIAVGARGRGDFASLLLGSVSRDVIHSADCAVYVIR